MIWGKTALLLSGIFAALCCCGADFDDLSSDDVGQLVYRKSDSKVFVFRKRKDDAFWEASLFKDNAVVTLRPESCEVMEGFNEKDLSPRAVAESLVFLRNCHDVEAARAYLFLARRINAPVINSVLSYDAAQNKFIRQLGDVRRQHLNERMKPAPRPKPQNVSSCPFQAPVAPAPPPPSPAELLSEKFVLFLEKNPCRTAIEGLINKENDLFLAFLLFLEYRGKVLRVASGVNFKNRGAVRRELEKTENALIRKFDRQREQNRKRESDFASLCPDRHGKWEHASPVTLDEMRRRVEDCFRALRKTWQTSPDTEFPEWGNAMLEVMQMINSPELETKFDSAYNVYQSRVKAASSN